MSFFLNLTTRVKLFLGFGMLIILMIGVVQLTYQEIVTMRNTQQQLYNRDFADAIDLANVLAYGNAMRADVQTMMLFSKRSEQEVWYGNVKDRTLKISEVMQRIFARPHTDQVFLAKLKETQALMQVYEHARDNEQVPLIFSGKLKEARDMSTTVQAERYTRIRALLLELDDIAEKHARAAVEESNRSSEKVIHSLIFMTVSAVLIAVAMTLLTARLIADPLKHLSEVARRVAAGDLTSKIQIGQRSDEVGILERAFHDMVERLRKLTLEIQEGINVLTTSSSEILATTSQVASSATENATAVSQTTTTVEEVKQTAQISSQKARQVSDNAQKASQISETGRKAVEEMIGGMDRIREQTSSAADSIGRLSEQNQAIGEIIATVNDLAEQSNVLAVNAAIEAAKAGEHGKGFAVVAQEIKSLAEQSKQATAQVRNILGDIQKAIGGTVMAIDLSSKAVEAGVQQSDAADDAIQQLTESISDAAQAAMQIAASSQQQLVGMDQVVLAMGNIKQSSTQNIAGSRQAEATAQDLHELGLKLKQIVEQYKV